MYYPLIRTPIQVVAPANTNEEEDAEQGTKQMIDASDIINE